MRLLLRYTYLLAAIVALSGCGEARSSADDRDELYYPQWLAEARHAPTFQVLDTDSKYGRYAKHSKTITLKDLIKFHGHFCGGLVESAMALQLALTRLFGEEPIDRTDLEIASNNSACGGDVAQYLTGARVRFGSHRIDPTLTSSEFVVRRLRSRTSVRVRVRSGAYPHRVRTLMKRIESGEATSEDFRFFQEEQWAYAGRLVSNPPSEAFEELPAASYKWVAPVSRDLGERKDNQFRDRPYDEPAEVRQNVRPMPGLKEAERKMPDGRH